MMSLEFCDLNTFTDDREAQNREFFQHFQNWKLSNPVRWLLSNSADAFVENSDYLIVD
jgi:hypothetical protein